MRTSWSAAEPLREEPLGKSRWERAVGKEPLEKSGQTLCWRRKWRAVRGGCAEARAERRVPPCADRIDRTDRTWVLVGRALARAHVDEPARVDPGKGGQRAVGNVFLEGPPALQLPRVQRQLLDLGGRAGRGRLVGQGQANSSGKCNIVSKV